MELFSKDELRSLVNGTGEPCVSLYQPTHRGGPDTQQDPIRLKNLLREAERGLLARGTQETEAAALLAPARRLLDDYQFWQHQRDGLAIFLSPLLFRTYRVQKKLPELAVVADRFHLKPMLSLIAEEFRFFVLALSQNRTRVFQATGESIIEMDADNLPPSLTEALENQLPERHLQSHTSGGTGRTPIYHGQGGGEEDRKELLLKYFQRVDQGVRELMERNRAPLILAAVDYLCPIYRQANSNPELLDASVSGSPDNLTPQDLHAKALPIAAAYFQKARDKAADQYLQLWHTRRASNILADVLPAACQGRVETLFVAVGVQMWGRFDAASYDTRLAAEPAAEDEDLLNLATLHTLLTGGTVYAVEPAQVPGGASLAAVYRY